MKRITQINILTLLTCFCILFTGKLTAQVIDFDQKYAYASGWKLISNINHAVANANPGDTIVFNSDSYDFDNLGFAIQKPITLSGKINTLPQQMTAGAHQVTTQFDNLLHINLFTNDATVQHIQFNAATTSTNLMRVRHSSYNSGQQTGFYRNLKVYNVVFNGGRTQAFGGNGAGIEFLHTSFINFSRGGFYLNRRDRSNGHPRMIMENCYFKPDLEQVNYDVRAVSFDAGNDEYPVVWDHNWTIIRNSLLDGTGIGLSSKGKNLIVRNNHIIGYRKDVDMIHIEEFSHDIIINNNIFEHAKPARTIYMEREAQPSYNIRIENNTFIVSA
ncbi:hypothetical protein [Catenovulum sediminis]|uniref:hypothetical protein n=1 Tax=Catenovulum sediminis TaxID=1740262 RepID=UPI00117E2F58|nr:hypothetical protein [Catenovulum sediminis]